MLVLTRRVDAGNGSVICIGNDIEITLVAVRGEQVRLAVEAPRDVPVHRGEIYDEIAEENAVMMAAARLPEAKP